MARGRREIPPCSKTYGFPIYCAAWVPIDRISAAAAAAGEVEEKEDKDEASEEAEEKEDKGKQGGDEGSEGETSPSSRKDRLLVALGGGGGEGRSGVPNALVISEFDLASRSLSNQPVFRMGTDAEVKRSITESREGWPKENGLPAGEKTSTPISAPHMMDSSLAFLKSPARRFEKQTCLPSLFSSSLPFSFTVLLRRPHHRRIHRRRQSFTRGPRQPVHALRAEPLLPGAIHAGGHAAGARGSRQRFRGGVQTMAVDALSASDEQKEEASILFKKLCLKLDALSHFNFAPKPVIEDMSEQANVPALAMEEIAPLAVSDAAMLAPEEIFEGFRGGVRGPGRGTRLRVPGRVGPLSGGGLRVRPCGLLARHLFRVEVLRKIQSQHDELEALSETLWPSCSKLKVLQMNLRRNFP